MHCLTDASFDYRTFRLPTSTRIPTTSPTRRACASGRLSCRCANGCTTSWSCHARRCIRRPRSDVQNRAPGDRGTSSLPLDHDFEVLARQHQRAVARAVAALHESQQVLGEGSLLLGIERAESIVHRTIVGAEHFAHLTNQRRVTTISRYSLGTTSEPAPAR